MKEPVTIQATDGRETTGEAEVVRYSLAGRISLATLFVVGGLLSGTACLFVPVVHLITTWALPALGIFMAYRTMQREMTVHQPEGECPNCGQRIELLGGSLDDPVWQVCPQCKVQLSVRASA